MSTLCPACGSPGVFLFTSFECSNSTCVKFKLETSSQLSAPWEGTSRPKGLLYYGVDSKGMHLFLLSSNRKKDRLHISWEEEDIYPCGVDSFGRLFRKSSVSIFQLRPRQSKYLVLSAHDSTTVSICLYTRDNLPIANGGGKFRLNRGEKVYFGFDLRVNE